MTKAGISHVKRVPQKNTPLVCRVQRTTIRNTPALATDSNAYNFTVQTYNKNRHKAKSIFTIYSSQSRQWGDPGSANKGNIYTIFPFPSIPPTMPRLPSRTNNTPFTPDSLFAATNKYPPASTRRASALRLLTAGHMPAALTGDYLHNFPGIGLPREDPRPALSFPRSLLQCASNRSVGHYRLAVARKIAAAAGAVSGCEPRCPGGGGTTCPRRWGIPPPPAVRVSGAADQSSIPPDFYMYGKTKDMKSIKNNAL